MCIRDREEAVASGIEDILIITNRGKGIIEDHFDHAIELEQRLEASGKTEMLETVRSLAHMANICFVRQKETRGLGHAINCARSFVGNEPFAVLYGDDVIMSDDPVCGQLCRAYGAYGCGVVGIKEVTVEQIQRYSSLKAVSYTHLDVYKRQSQGSSFPLSRERHPKTEATPARSSRDLEHTASPAIL